MPAHPLASKHLLGLAVLGAALLLARPARADAPPPPNECTSKQPGEACDARGRPGTCGTIACNRLDYSKGSPPQVVEAQCVDCVATTDATATPPPAASSSATPSPTPAAAPPPASESAGRCRIDGTGAPAILLLLAGFLRRRRR